MAVEHTEVDPAKVEAFMGRLIEDFAGAGAVPLTLIGIRTGLWAALAGAGPLSPAEVAERSGTAKPYVAGWLKAQAAGGYLAYHPEGGRFSLPAEAAAVLADEHGTRLVGGFAQMLLAMSRDWVLVDELARVVGLGGRPRRLGDERERARKAVSARIRDALDRVERAHPALGRHLRETISTGTSCAYTPAAPVDWEL
jgi:hypothetical protein